MSNKNYSYYFPRFSVWILILGMGVLAWLYGFDKIITLRPQSFHRWRQCDCLAFTQTYYHDGNAFWDPKVLYLGEDGTGRTASDFPLIYYTVAQLWKLFGKHEFIYRSLVLLLTFFGFLALFRMTEDILKDSFMALWVSFIMYSSPILVYYSNNFLMNVPAFSLGLIGLYLFYLFYKRRKNKYLYGSMLFYTLGGLLKVPALTSYVMIVVLMFLEIFRIIKPEKRLFFDLRKQIPALLSVVLVVAAWYIYAHGYNERYNKGMFLIGILPIWDLDRVNIKFILDSVNLLWKDSYQSLMIQAISVLMFLVVLIFRKKNHPLIWWATVILATGFVSFVLLWFQVFNNHDYYIVNQLIFMIAVFISFFYLIRKSWSRLWKNVFFRLVLLLVLVLNVSHCRYIIHLRYYDWPNKHYTQYTKALEDITPYLRNELGISSEDTVLFIDDPSLNISLYMIEQRGYTNFSKKLTDTAFINEKILQGAKYLFVNDSALLGEPYLIPYTHDRIGKYKNICIFRLR
jgi:hypothetical protein